MRLKGSLTLVLSVLLAASPVFAAGKLHFYNWAQYTSPELLKKFTEETGITVTVDNFDSNETMIAKIKAGGHGYDLSVAADYIIPFMVKMGLLQKIGINQLGNFKNIRPEHVDVDYDPGRQHSIPWHWGTTGISLNTQYYNGPKADSWALLFDPPDELKGKINMLASMNAVINAALFYLDLPKCNSNKADLKKVNDLLIRSKQHWATIDTFVLEKMMSEDIYASQNWNGASLSVRMELPLVKYIFPKEGMHIWQDNVVLLADAKNVKEAKIFLNFIMAPENAALMTNFSRFANAIIGSEQYLDAKIATAPEMTGAGGAVKTVYIPQCSQKVTAIYTKIWNNLLK